MKPDPMKIPMGGPPKRDKKADIARFVSALDQLRALMTQVDVESPGPSAAEMLEHWSMLTDTADGLGLPGAALMSAAAQDTSEADWPFVWEGVWSDGLITQRRQPCPPSSLPVLFAYLAAWAGRHKKDCPHGLVESRCRSGDRLIITWDHRTSKCEYANDPKLEDVDKARRFVDEIFLLTADNPEDETESGVSMEIEPGVILPWCAVHRSAIKSVLTIGQQAAVQMRKPIRFVRYVRAEVVQVIQPPRKVE